MTSTDRLQGIVHQIQTTLARRSEKAGAARTRGGTGGARSGRLTLEELRTELRSGMIGLDLSIAAEKRRARRLFIESVLLSEFGVGLANDARFTAVVGGIESAFSEDPQLNQELDAVVAELGDKS